MAVDFLGHTIKQGMTVVTHYWQDGKKDLILKVKAVRGSYVSLVDIEPRSYNKEATVISAVRTLNRKADEVIVIDQQLEYNEKTFPENIL